MSIFVTGDIHGDHDILKLYDDSLLEYCATSREDYLIVCGDFGAIWYGDGRDTLLDEFYATRPYTILFVDGNHENFNALNEYDVEYWKGGKVHKICDNVYHLMRGQVYEIDGKTIFTFGGAKSIDKMNRVEDVSWWAQEMPSLEEYEEAAINLEKVNYTVDYVFTHCAATSVIKKINPLFAPDILTSWFEEIEKKLTYKHWYFGHYHKDMRTDNSHTCLYDFVQEVGATDEVGALLEKEAYYQTQLEHFYRLVFTNDGSSDDVKEFYEFFKEYWNYRDKPNSFKKLLDLKYQLEMRFLKRHSQSPLPFYCYVDEGGIGNTLNASAFFSKERDAIIYCNAKEKEDGVTCFYTSDYRGLKGLEKLMGEGKGHYRD